MCVILFLGAIVLANLSVAYFGPASMPINAFILIGLDLSLRDRIHEQWHNKGLVVKMLALVCIGVLITYFFNRGAGAICLGSIVAFSAALVVDTILYQVLFKKTHMIKINGSNTGSALVDSILFPTIAFGVFMPWVIALQFFAKVSGGALWSLILSRKA